jgi:cytidylate kinase
MVFFYSGKGSFFLKQHSKKTLFLLSNFRDVNITINKSDMHISITGDLGSGKSSVAKILCETLGYKYISTGVIQRKKKKKKGMNTLEFNKYTDENKEVDDYIDQHLKDINEGDESHILDSRLAWFFVNKSFKVYLTAFNQIAAQRILNDNDRIGEPNAADVDIKIKESEKRRNLENSRFERYYGVKYDIFDNFDLIIDTSYAALEQVVEMILSAYAKWKQKLPFNKIWFSTKRIYPLENISVINSNAAKKIRDAVKKEGYNEDFPVLLLKLSDHFYMYDGHLRFSAALFNQLPLIPVEVIARETETIPKGCSAEQYVKERFQLSNVHDWEKAHDFKYFEYPVL